jgi:hypothetical protein
VRSRLDAVLRLASEMFVFFVHGRLRPNGLR